MSVDFSVVGVQVECTPGDYANNHARARDLILSSPGHDLYVLPELSSPGYFDEVFARRQELAESVTDGPSKKFFGALAREVNSSICYGLLIRRSGGSFSGEERREEDGDYEETYTIGQAVVNPSGDLVASFEKMHLCNLGVCSEVGQGMSHSTKDGGEPQVCVFDLVKPTPRDAAGRKKACVPATLKVGLCICYDIRFPELWREMAWRRGADLILHPAAFIRDETFPSWHPFVMTRAMENQVYVLSISHAGEEFGNSVAMPPWVGPVATTEKGGGAITLAPIVLDTRKEGILGPLVVSQEILCKVRSQFTFRKNARMFKE